jgi:hypothetical protein
MFSFGFMSKPFSDEQLKLAAQMPEPSKETLAEFMAQIPPALCHALAVKRSPRVKVGRGRRSKLKTVDEIVAVSGLSRRTVTRLCWMPSWDRVDIGVASRFIQGCGVDIFHQSFRHYFIEKNWDRDLPHLLESHRQRLKKVLGLE